VTEPLTTAKYFIVQGDREWADAPTLLDALAGAKIIAREEQIDFAIENASGRLMAWAFADGTTKIVQGSEK